MDANNKARVLPEKDSASWGQVSPSLGIYLLKDDLEHIGSKVRWHTQESAAELDSYLSIGHFS